MRYCSSMHAPEWAGGVLLGRGVLALPYPSLSLGDHSGTSHRETGKPLAPNPGLKK